MENLATYLESISDKTRFKLSYPSSKGYLILGNSGRGSESKEFALPLISLANALEDILENISSFPSRYDEKEWRKLVSQYVNDVLVKSLVQSQTKAFFETINKLLSWVSGSEYKEDEMSLNAEHVEKAVNLIRSSQIVLREKIKLPESARDCAKIIIKNLYNFDKFQKIAPIIKLNTANIKIDTSEFGKGNTLSCIFYTEASDCYNTTRSFSDESFLLNIDGKDVLAQLTNQWNGFENESTGSNSSLFGLKDVVNHYYSNKFEILKENDGCWYFLVYEENKQRNEFSSSFENNSRIKITLEETSNNQNAKKIIDTLYKYDKCSRFPFRGTSIGKSLSVDDYTVFADREKTQNPHLFDDIYELVIDGTSKEFQLYKVWPSESSGKKRNVLNLINSVHKYYPNTFDISYGGDENKESVTEKDDGIFTPTQIIYYGVPGCGKSHQIREDLKKKGIPAERTMRVVFHPDYCNADFVGQILPETKGGTVRYNFKAGPFAKILREAYANPKLEYALIIEEINRGNAAAIFGDLFQLLDRKKDGDEPETVNRNTYGKGWSDYCVNNDYINAYFRGAYDSDDAKVPAEVKVGDVTVNANVDIRLPPNLSIYATMNTSDQNVFTLDNAFQRRWEMKQVPNELKDSGESADQYEQTIKMVRKSEDDEEIVDTNVQWGDFRKAINEVIMDSAQTNGLSSMEDKRLGGWFFTPSDNFAEKVLKYLWDDAFKFDRPNQFDKVKTLEKLVEDFNKDGFKVFKDERISNLQKDASVTPSGSTQNDSPDVNG